MNIQLSPIRVIPDVLTVWQEPGPEVDLVMDLRNLTFAPGSLEAIFSFHVIDHLTIEDSTRALKNWYTCLKQPGTLFVLVDDFEHIARAFVGGEISIDKMNEHFVHPSQYTQENLLNLLNSAGFSDPSIKIWYGQVPNLFQASEEELIMSADK